MLKRFILWDYRRGSWQYDVIVGIIVAFIFLTPRTWFRDWPRTPQAQTIATVPGGFFVPPEQQLEDVSESERTARLAERVRAQAGNRGLKVTRVERILDSEGELLGYLVFAR
jgi:hypothetical protein